MLLLITLLMLSVPAPLFPRQGDPPPQSGETTGPADSEQSPAPLPPPGEMARCKALIDAGRYVEARGRLQPIVDRHPGWARASLLLGLSYYREHRYEAAGSLFARALAADPDEVAILPYYGFSLYALGDLDRAEEIFDALLERMPELPTAHYALGLVHRDRDEVAAARERFEATARLAAREGDRPMEGRAHGRLGDLFLRLDELHSARQELELALELFPDDADAVFTLSRVLERLGDQEGADEARRRFEGLALPGRPAPMPLPD